MKQTLSEFMGCEDWEKDELCAFIDKQHEELKARDELIRDMWPWVWESGIPTCKFNEIKKRMEAFGIEVNDD